MFYNYKDVFHIFKKFQRFHSNAYIYDLEVYPSIWDTLYYSAWGQKRQHQLIFQQPPYIFIFQFCSVYWLYNKISAVLFFLVFVAMDKNFIYFQDDFTFCWVKWSVLCKYKVPWKPRKFSIFKCDFSPIFFYFHCRCSILTSIMMHCNYQNSILNYQNSILNLNLEAMIIFQYFKKPTYFLTWCAYKRQQKSPSRFWSFLKMNS